MIRRIDLRSAATGRTPGEPFDYRTALPRADFDVEAAVPATHAICEEVRTRGLEAILEMSQKFDGVTQSDIRVPVEEMTRALEELDPAIRAGLEESVRRLRVASEAELEQDVVTDLGPGARVVHRKVPVGRVGLYVPGGLAPLVSSVLMNVVPAQVAGVPSLALASPPQKEFGGLPHPTILAACALLGVEEVYAVGGAQAIAMFAYGTGPCAKVDLVTGPGNIWVVTAKRLLKGLVGVDSEAGPTEVAILADETADAAYVAADLISEAERLAYADRDAYVAACRPVVELARRTDGCLAFALTADSVDPELEKQVATTGHVERVKVALGGAQSGIVLVDDLDQGVEVCDAYASEHLEIQTRDAAAVAARIRNAGAIFIGDYAPTALGDYCAGSNHVLPTGGCACHSSGLSVRAFTKSVHVVDYSREGLEAVADHVVTLAEAEDLPGHGQSVRIRFQR